jgi:hypothetical protein
MYVNFVESSALHENDGADTFFGNFIYYNYRTRALCDVIFVYWQ